MYSIGHGTSRRAESVVITLEKIKYKSIYFAKRLRNLKYVILKKKKKINRNSDSRTSGT